MERDDTNLYGVCVFAALLAFTAPLFVFAVLRICRHLKSAQSFPCLQAFYVVLALFLLCRFVYFLDILCHYEDWVYFSLDLMPVALIFTAASIVAYLWHRIAEEFMTPFDTSRKRLSAYCYWTIGSNIVYYLLFSVPFIVLYPANPTIAI